MVQMIFLSQDETDFPEKFNYQKWLKKGGEIWIDQYL